MTKVVPHSERMQTRKIGGAHREKQVVLFRIGAADGKTTSGAIINERVKLTVTDIVREAILGPPPTTDGDRN